MEQESPCWSGFENLMKASEGLRGPQWALGSITGLREPTKASGSLKRPKRTLVSNELTLDSNGLTVGRLEAQFGYFDAQLEA